MKWFRLYNEVVNDPKVQLLPADVFKTWINLLCIAAQKEGKLPDSASLAFSLRLSVAEMDLHLDHLVKQGLIDRLKEGYQPHNWEDRQFKSDSSKERVRKYRKKLQKRNCNVTVTPNVTLQEAEADTEAEYSAINGLNFKLQSVADLFNSLNTKHFSVTSPLSAKSSAALALCEKIDLEKLKKVFDEKMKMLKAKNRTSPLPMSYFFDLLQEMQPKPKAEYKPKPMNFDKRIQELQL